MKILIAYYSRTGTTKKVAKMIKEKLNADIEEIKDGKKYKGPIGYLKGGFNATTGRLSSIEETHKNPSDYDLTIIATPVWASHVAPGVSTYIYQNSKKFNEIAAFVTCGSGGGEQTLNQISEESGKQLEASMILTKKDIKTDLDKKINTFINKIKK